MSEETKIKMVNFTGYQSSVFSLLDTLSFAEKLSAVRKIIIKPNLLDAVWHPCTTDVNCVRAIVDYVRKIDKNISIVVIEGSGGCKTSHAFEVLEYCRLEEIKGVKLLDVDAVPIIRLENKNAIVFREIFLPEIIFNGFFISVPALKDHLLTTVSLSLKNLIGLLPEKYYGGYWNYKRSAVHMVGINNAIVDLNMYIKTDLTVIDGRIGQYGSHLPDGRLCSPPKNVLIGGYDALETDKFASKILGHDWKSIRHLKLFSETKILK